MHMPGAAADGAIVNPAEAAGLAWRRLEPERWPLPAEAFPPEAALVGGAVRDALLDRLASAPDLDLVVEGDAIKLCRQLGRRHGGSCVVLDAERSMARLVIGGWSIDLARRDGADLDADLHRRDYTINAMALPLADRRQLVDPLDGLSHLQARQLVAVAEDNLRDDPLRLLRGLRLAAELNFELDATTRSWITQHHQAIACVAGERVLAELEKLAAAPGGEPWLAQCVELGLLTPWRACSWSRDEADRLAR
jgi:tRNA nucleotidyltransferase (CCA-adding enzyme)